MTNRETAIMFKIIAALFVSAMLIIGCAQTNLSEPEPAPGSRK